MSSFAAASMYLSEARDDDEDSMYSEPFQGTVPAHLAGDRSVAYPLNASNESLIETTIDEVPEGDLEDDALIDNIRSPPRLPTFD